MKPGDLKIAREKYSYVPARLVKGEANCSDIECGPLTLKTDVPADWPVTKEHYSSWDLDEYHRGLLHSQTDSDLLHGLLSVVFWGYASGSDGRIRAPRALEKTKEICFGRVGKKNAPAQKRETIVGHIKRCRELLKQSQDPAFIRAAFSEALNVKFLQMAFASKLLTFICPSTLAVYDDVISSRLQQSHDLHWLFVSTKIPTSAEGRISQATTYQRWCRWCTGKAAELQGLGMTWTDWDGKQRVWRALDVERAFYSLGR